MQKEKKNIWKVKRSLNKKGRGITFFVSGSPNHLYITLEDCTVTFYSVFISLSFFSVVIHAVVP